MTSWYIVQVEMWLRADKIGAALPMMPLHTPCRYLPRPHACHAVPVHFHLLAQYHCIPDTCSTDLFEYTRDMTTDTGFRFLLQELSDDTARSIFFDLNVHDRIVLLPT
jgi:hypothetical protein